MHPSENLLPRLQETIESILRSVPLVSHVKSSAEVAAVRTSRVDLVVDVTLKTSTHHQLALELKQVGHPRQLREAFNQLLRYTHHEPNRHLVPVVAAPFITEQGAAMCREDDINYCDIAGNCRLNFGGIFIERTGRKNTVRRAVSVPDLYAPRCERVLRVLLDDPLRPWKVTPLSAAAEVSLGTVSTVRKLLLDREWATETPNGFALRGHDRLLKEWSAVWTRRRMKPMGFISLDDTATTESRLASCARSGFPDAKLALTGLAAAWRHAQWVRYNRTQVYWSGDVQALASAAKLKPTDSGANVQFLAPRDDWVFHGARDIAGVSVVSPIQTFLDLGREPARGTEAAEFLWNQVISPQNAGAE
jgi:Transcriptional regulator, AbiEi antitoxin, Type IV TA system